MRSINEMGIDTRIIYEKLSTLKINEVVTYQELEELIKRSCKPGSPGYGNLRSAERITLREDGIVISAVFKVGRKRLDDAGMVDGSDTFLRRSRRAARKGQLTLAAVEDYGSLDTSRKIKHNTYMSLFGVWNAITRPQKIKRLDSFVGKEQRKLSIVKTLDFFKSYYESKNNHK